MRAAQAACITLTREIPLDRQFSEIGVQIVIDVQIEVSAYAGCSDRCGRQSLHKPPDRL